MNFLKYWVDGGGLKRQIEKRFSQTLFKRVLIFRLEKVLSHDFKNSEVLDEFKNQSARFI